MHTFVPSIPYDIRGVMSPPLKNARRHPLLCLVTNAHHTYYWTGCSLNINTVVYMHIPSIKFVPLGQIHVSVPQLASGGQQSRRSKPYHSGVESLPQFL